jgi:HK97 family phage portal protein
MPLVDAIKSLFIKPETKAIVGVDPIYRTNPISFSGGAFQPRYDANVADAHSQTFYTILTHIQETAKTIPWSVNKVTGTDETGKKLPNHRLADLLYRPNSYQSWAQFVTKYIGLRLATGNAFIYVRTNDSGLFAGEATELHLMPTSTEVVAGKSWQEPVAGYRLLLASGGYQEFSLDQIIHVKNYALGEELYGISPVQVGALAIRSLDLNMKQRIYQAAKGGPDRVFWNTGEAESLTEDQERELKRKLESPKNYTYLNSPIATAQLGLSPVDLDLLNSLQADAGMIADLLHYPAILLSNSKSSTYNNVTEANKALYNNCVIPLIYDLKEGLNKRLGGAYKDRVDINYDLGSVEVLKPNKAELIIAAATANFLTINEKRIMAGYPALLKSGDGFLLSAADIYSPTIDEEREQPQPDTYNAEDSAVEGD